MPLLQESMQRNAVKRKIRIVEAASSSTPPIPEVQRPSESASPTISIQQEQPPTPASIRSRYFGDAEVALYVRPRLPTAATVIHPAYEFEMPTFEELEIMGPIVREDPDDSLTMLEEDYTKKAMDFGYVTDVLNLTNATAYLDRADMQFKLNGSAAAAALPGTSKHQASVNDFLICSASDGNDGRSDSLSISSDSDSPDSSFHSDANSSLDGFESDSGTKYYLASPLLDFGSHSNAAVDKRKPDLQSVESLTVGGATPRASAKRSVPHSDKETVGQMNETSFSEDVEPVGSVENSEKGRFDLRNASVSTNGGTAEDEGASSESVQSHGTIRTIPRVEERVYEKGALVYINANASRKDTPPYWYPGEIVDVGYTISHWQDEYTRITAVSYTIKYVFLDTIDNVKRKFYTGQHSKECLTAELLTPDSPEMRKKAALDNAAFVAPAPQPKKSRRQNNTAVQQRRGPAPRARATSVINPSVLQSQKEGTRSSARIRGKSVALEKTKQQQQPESRRIDHSAIITRRRRKESPK